MASENRIVILEGNIGAGKTTFCAKLKELDPEHTRTYVEAMNTEFLALFYAQPEQYGFSFQMRMLATRIYQWRLAQKDAKLRPRPLNLWDRSMFGDYMFAVWNYLQGSISAREMHVYEAELGSGSLNDFGKLPFLSAADLVVFLDCEPAECKRRSERRGTASEKGIPSSYYDGIDDLHFHFLCQMHAHGSAPIMSVTLDQYHDSHAAVKRRILAATQDDSPFPTIFFTPPESLAKLSFEFTDAELVHEFYASNFTTVNFQETPRETLIVVPAGEMTLSDPWAAEKIKVPLDQLRYKDIVFYSNALKRTVSWFLSRGFSVYMKPVSA